MCMKSIIFTLALALPIAVNAQREYSRTYDDLYIVDGTKAVVYDYDYNRCVIVTLVYKK